MERSGEMPGGGVTGWLTASGSSGDRAERGSDRAREGTPPSAPELIEVEDLKVYFPIERGLLFRRVGGYVQAVDGVSFSIRRGETLGLVGESGCGKSTTGRAILRLVPITAGRIAFEGEDLAALRGERLRQARRNFQMIFQDPYASLDPRMTVGDIVAEPLRTFGLLRGRALRAEVEELLRIVGLSARFLNRYPHEFSGGQRQRIGIARALALKPKLIVADEPISALDVSIQAQILNLLQELQERFDLTYLFIAHDLAAVKQISDRIAVMYLGRIVELAPYSAIYDEPLHPYTQALISAVPVPDPDIEATRRRIVLTGDVPSPIAPPSGCRFHTRCPVRVPRCAHEDPPLREYSPGHHAACHLLEMPTS